MNGTMRSAAARQAIVWGVVALGAGGVRPADAQVGAPAAQGVESLVATDPIRCWWRTGKSAVYVGERFSLTVTCSVVDTPGVRVVPDQSRLDPAALQLPPFNVVEGARHADIQAGQRRLFQYEYSLRLVAEDLFGRQVAIPALDVSYRVQNQVEAAAAVESLEQTYRLPALPVQVLALVPPQAADIRDASAATFGEIENRRFRGNVAFAVAALLFSACLGSLAVAALVSVRRYRTPADRIAPLLSETGMLRSAIRQLERVQEEVSRDGWSRDAMGRALAAVRLGFAIALGLRPPQIVLEPGVPGRDGAVIVTTGVLRPKRVMVSASVTADAAGAAAEPGSGAVNGDARRPSAAPVLDEFRSILAVLTAARYARQEDLPREPLDEAVTEAIALMRRLRAGRSWPASAAGGLHRMVSARWPRAQ